MRINKRKDKLNTLYGEVNPVETVGFVKHWKKETTRMYTEETTIYI